MGRRKRAGYVFGWTEYLSAQGESNQELSAKVQYYDMIRAWGGWELLQQLLVVLKEIAGRRGVDVSNVAARWVLERPETGVVIVGKQVARFIEKAEKIRRQKKVLDLVSLRISLRLSKPSISSLHSTIERISSV